MAARYPVPEAQTAMVLVLFAALATGPSWADGSATFAGKVQSNAGGFVFPDGTLQATACTAGERIVFLGLSESAFSGSAASFDSGLRALDEKCQMEVNGATRMCFSSELLQTEIWPADDPSPTVAGAFRPQIQFIDSTDLYDLSGVSAPISESLNCNGWFTEGSGVMMPTVTNDGQFGTANCLSNGNIGVACCGPVKP